MRFRAKPSASRCRWGKMVCFSWNYARARTAVNVDVNEGGRETGLLKHGETRRFIETRTARWTSRPSKPASYRHTQKNRRRRRKEKEEEFMTDLEGTT